VNEINEEQLQELLRDTAAWCRPEDPGWRTLEHRLEPPRPSRIIRFAKQAARIAAVAAVLFLAVSVFLGVQLNETRQAKAAADATIKTLQHQLETALGRIEQLIEGLGIDKAVDDDGPALIPAERDRIGVKLLIDARYVQRVRFRASQGSEFVPIYEGPPTAAFGKQPNLVRVSGVSRPLRLDGRVVEAEVLTDLYPRLDESLVSRLIPEHLRRQTREFLLSQQGVVADPRRIDHVRDIRIHAIAADADEENVNRYFVTGRITGFRDGMYAYLVVDPITVSEVWVTSALEPDANGDFAVRAFLGDGSRPATALGRQIYRLFVCLAPASDTLDEGDRRLKPVNWSELGCIVGPAKLKRNDGLDGFVDTPVNE